MNLLLTPWACLGSRGSSSLISRERTYAVLDAYLEPGDPFEGHPLKGVL
jgi:hypothetical protein